MSRGNQVARQWRLLQVLETKRQGMTVGQIASHEECSVRTIYRDLMALVEAGFPLYAEEVKSPNEPQVWRFVDTYRLKFPLPFSFTELLSLYMACDLFQVLEGTAFHQAILDAFKKIEVTLTPETRAFLDRVRGTFVATAGFAHHYETKREILETLTDAVLKHVTCEMEYAPLARGKAGKRQIDPHKVWFSQGSLYVIGYCHLRKDMRTFSVDRIKYLTLTEVTFQVRKDFDFEKYRSHSLQVSRSKEVFRLHIRFTEEAATLIQERKWFPKQKIEIKRDGSVELTAEATGMTEILHWVLGFGANAEVLAPVSLRELIQGELREAMSHYQKRLKISA